MKYLALILSIICGFFAIIISCQYILLLYGLIESIEIPIVLEGTIEYSEIKLQLIGQDFGTLAICVLCIILFACFYSLYHRLNRKKKDTLNKDDIHGPFVLYLRSFMDDDVTQKKVSFFTDIRSEEEIMVSVLTDIAPVYALGDPKDKKMPLGASRIYVEDEHWISTVTEMVKKASVVVLRLGKTDSFWWEVEMAIKSIPIEKILFVVPKSKTFSNVANLYKILLDNNIDISNIDINIGEKLRGSISSLLYFDKDGNAQSAEIKVARFTNLFISYENVLRNTLAGFRAKFGLSANRQRSIRVARLLQLFLIFYLLLIGCSSYFNDYTSLKYQMPYELVEECVQDSAFVAKYSNSIDGSNLVWSIIESRKGSFALDDEDFIFLFLVESNTIASVSRSEYEQINKQPKNLLLMIKKYSQEYYLDYVSLLAVAANLSLHYSDEIESIISSYQSSSDSTPQWIIDLFNNMDDSLSEYDQVLLFNETILDHIEDEGISDVIKIFSSQSIVIKD